MKHDNKEWALVNAERKKESKTHGTKTKLSKTQIMKTKLGTT